MGTLFEDRCTFMISFSIVNGMINFLDKSLKNKRTFYVPNVFPKTVPFMQLCVQFLVEPAGPQMQM
jgi:hypothetical protein